MSFRELILDRLDEIDEHLKALGTTDSKVALSTEIRELKREIVEQQIKRDKQKEEHEREKRDVKHMVGLEKKRQEFEIQQAKRETEVTVREENLTADKNRFAKQMEFQQERFEKEVGYLKSLMEQVLNRLPTVTVDRQVGGSSRSR
jgi:hypothetical protein